MGGGNAQVDRRGERTHGKHRAARPEECVRQRLAQAVEPLAERSQGTRGIAPRSYPSPAAWGLRPFDQRFR